MKIPSTAFKENLCSFVSFKVKLLKKSFSRKTNSYFAVKLAEKSTIHFYCLFDDHIFQIYELLIRDNEKYNGTSIE